MPIYSAKSNKRVRVGDVIETKGRKLTLTKIIESSWLGTGIYCAETGNVRHLPSSLELFTSSVDADLFR
jgi:hypothetical protein